MILAALIWNLNRLLGVELALRKIETPRMGFEVFCLEFCVLYGLGL